MNEKGTIPTEEKSDYQHNRGGVMILKPIIGVNKYTILVASHEELTDDRSIDFGIMFSTPLSVKTLEQDLPFYSNIGALE